MRFDALFTIPLPGLRASEIERLAEDVGLDVKRLRADLAGGSCGKAVDADLAEGKALGIQSLPTLYVNGLKVMGQRTLAELCALIEDESAPGILSSRLGASP